MRISDWSSDVCSSDLAGNRLPARVVAWRSVLVRASSTRGFPCFRFRFSGSCDRAALGHGFQMRGRQIFQLRRQHPFTDVVAGLIHRAHQILDIFAVTARADHAARPRYQRADLLEEAAARSEEVTRKTDGKGTR